MFTASSGRWGGLGAALGGLLWLAGTVLNRIAPADSGPPYWEVTNPVLYQVYGVMMAATILLFVVGIAGLSTYAVRSGWPGRVGILVALVAAVVSFIGIVATAISNNDALWPAFAIALLISLAGLVVVGVGTMLARSLGRWSAVPLVIGLLGVLWAFANPDVPPYSEAMVWARFSLGVLFGLAWVLLGYALWSERAITSRPVDTRPEPASV